MFTAVDLTKFKRKAVNGGQGDDVASPAAKLFKCNPVPVVHPPAPQRGIWHHAQSARVRKPHRLVGGYAKAQAQPAALDVDR
jgi:hypothetical protein